MPKGAPQPRVHERVDIDVALERSHRALHLWERVRWHAPAPAFSGGVMSWPHWATDALRICREESDAIVAYVRHDRAENERRKGARVG